MGYSSAYEDIVGGKNKGNDVFRSDMSPNLVPEASVEDKNKGKALIVEEISFDSSLKK